MGTHQAIARIPELRGKPVKVPLSDTVAFQYFEQDGKHTGEGLVASDRWYPAIHVGERYLFGLRQDDRFIPGIAWCGRFIPGLMTRSAFFPGLALESRFVPGVIASGAFVPGIIKKNGFVPGIVGEGRFVPGFFMTDERFMPGRFFRRQFENGVWNKGTFVTSDADMIPAADAYALGKEEIGLASLKRFDAVGGLPICGIVCGAVGATLAFVDRGLFTDEGVILGGLWDNENLPTVDPEGTMKEKLGIDAAGQLLGTDKAYDKFVEMAERFGEGINSPFGGVAGGMYGGNVNIGADLADALNSLSAGANDLIDRLNGAYNDYWSDAFDSNPGGMITEGDGWSKAKQWATVIGAGVGFLTGGLGGAAAGAGIGQVIVAAAQWIYETIAGTSEEKPEDGSDKPKPGSSAPGEPGEEGGEPYAYRQPRGFMPIYIESRRQVVVTVSDNQYSDYTGRRKVGGITFVNTDTGPRAIVNMSELRRMGRLGGGRSIVLGLNPLTGELMTVSGRPLSAAEARKRTVRDLIWSLTHPDPGHP